MKKRISPKSRKEQKAIRKQIDAALYQGLTGKQKGDLLERAVQDLERHLMQNYSVEQNAQITITSGKKYQMNGAPKEIDLFIEIKERERTRIMIYECKNRNEAADPEKIIYFQRKMDDWNAELGFFIAKEFTQGCLDEAEADNRLRLLNASDDFINIDRLMDMSYGCVVGQPRYVIALKTVDGQFIQMTENGTLYGSVGPVTFEQFAKSHLDIPGMYLETFERRNSSGTLGTSHEHLFKERKFEPPLPKYDGQEIMAIRIEFKFDYYLATGKLISYFDIESSGRHVVRKILDENGNEIEFVGMERS